MPKSKEKDPFQRLKHIAYCMSNCPPKDHTYDDFVLYAKFQLCIICKVLWKDPIWDNYGDEEILVEYFAHAFNKSEDFQKEFEASLDFGYSGDDLEWFNKQIKKNKNEVKNSVGEFECSPETFED